MQQNDIKVSVIMPVYNSGEYLNTAVESILEQNLREIEVILVDDGSTDGSSKKCDEYAKKDSRVIVIHQKNGGICNARNAALRIARGEYVAFSDHDDEYLPGFLYNAYHAAIANRAEMVKVGKKDFIIQDSKILRTKYSRLYNKVYNRNDIRTAYFQLVDSCGLECLWDGLFRRDVIVDNNLWLDEYFKNGGEDIDFLQRFIVHTNILVTIDTIYYNHYIRKGFSTSSIYNARNILAKQKVISGMRETMKALNLKAEDYPFEYTYLLLRQYIAPLCAIYSNDGCELSYEEKKNKIKRIKNEDFYYNFCNTQSVYRMSCVSKKYALLYFLFKNGFYGLILKMYKKRTKTA